MMNMTSRPSSPEKRHPYIQDMAVPFLVFVSVCKVSYVAMMRFTFYGM
jgi:hypothetical protein